MFQSIGQLFKALFAVASTVERVAVSLDNVAKVGQAHSVNLLKETLTDLDVSEEDLALMSTPVTKD